MGSFMNLIWLICCQNTGEVTPLSPGKTHLIGSIYIQWTYLKECIGQTQRGKNWLQETLC
jgi:hypothetical protein